MKIYDLSLPFRVTDMVFPGTPPMKYEQSHTVEKDFYNLGIAGINTHAGTHIDAPKHFLAEGYSVGEIPLEKCVGECCVVDVTYIGANEEIDVKDVCNYEEEIRLKKRIMLYTGWSQYHNTEKYYMEYPKLTLALCEYLVELGVVLVGVEAPSLNPERYIETHKAFSNNEVVILEGLCNLDKIAGKNIIISVAPIKFFGADGFPVRAYAIEK